MSDTYGLSSRTPLAFFDPASSSWKTSRLTFLSDSTASSLTLPASGMTRRGVLYALPMSEPATDGPDYSCLPTPRANADRASRASLTRQGHWSAPSLGQALELMQGILPREYESWEEVQGWHGSLLPTPTTEPMTGNGHARNLGKEAALLRTPQASVTEPKPGIKLTGRTLADPQVGLADQVMALLPTPAANEYDHQDVEGYLERRERQKEMGRNGNGFGLVLSMAVKMLPTPMGRDGKGQTLPREGGDDLNGAMSKLLPTPTTGYTGTTAEEWRDRRPAGNGQRRETIGDLGLVAQEMSSGAPTRQRSPATPSSSADVPLTLWTEEDD